MEKFDCTLEGKVSVEFVDEDKAVAVFIDGDWAEYFFKLDNLEEIAKHLALMYHRLPTEVDKESRRFKYIEGFGQFFWDSEKSIWRGGSYEGDAGEITIKVEEEIYVSDCDPHC